QIPEPIKRQDLNDRPSEIKGFMETALLALDDKSGIKADSCPEELVECLINIHKVLTNDGKEFVEKVDREASEDIAKMTLEERRRNFYQTFALAQRLMGDAKARKQSLEGKTYRDVETKNRFAANLSDYDQTGKLNLASNPIYQASRFNADEQAQINQALNITQQQAQVQQTPYE
ncbi:28338_t:CDS:2, partial [Racocetra persica]